MKGKTWAYAQQGLLAIASASRFQRDPRYRAWAKTMFDGGLDTYRRMSGARASRSLEPLRGRRTHAGPQRRRDVRRADGGQRRQGARRRARARAGRRAAAVLRLRRRRRPARRQHAARTRRRSSRSTATPSRTAGSSSRGSSTARPAADRDRRPLPGGVRRGDPRPPRPHRARLTGGAPPRSVAPAADPDPLAAGRGPAAGAAPGPARRGPVPGAGGRREAAPGTARDHDPAPVRRDRDRRALDGPPPRRPRAPYSVAVQLPTWGRTAAPVALLRKGGTLPLAVGGAPVPLGAVRGFRIRGPESSYAVSAAPPRARDRPRRPDAARGREPRPRADAGADRRLGEAVRARAARGAGSSPPPGAPDARTQAERAGLHLAARTWADPRGPEES